MFNLNGKTALVTGATGGIGGAVAKALHAQGASVVLTGRREAELQTLQKELGERAKVITADLSKVDDIERLVKEAGDLHILVNNAGLTKDGLLMRMSDEDWDAVLDVNLKSAFQLSRAVIRGMMKNRWGRIISISSVVGVMGNAGQCNYAASKAGMIGFSKSLAQEVASRNVTVNCVAPGFIVTPMTDVLNDEQKAKLTERIPAGRLGTVDDIAAAVTFLASEEASYLTGQTLNVNGGMIMI